MEISDVKVKLVENRSDKLLAFCTITIETDFVIRDLKIIEGPKGAFVAMPSRKLTDRCQKCGGKNHRLAKFCNGCGGKLIESRPRRGDGPRTRLHADIAHPITSECREFLQKMVLAAYQDEVDRSKEEGYVPPDLDVDFREEVAENGKGVRPDERHRPMKRQEPPAPRPPVPEPAAPEPPVRSEPPPLPPPPERSEPSPLPSPPSGDESEDNFGSGIFR